MNKKPRQGWGFPYSGRKAHYFIGVRSLCRKWLYAGELEQGNDNSPDNCKICKRMVKERKEMEDQGCQ